MPDALVHLDAPIVLHCYFRSAASYRVRLALSLKGVDYASVTHHLRKNEHRTPEYLALNPQGLLPAMEVGSQVLTQSLAICEYLDEVYPMAPLLPQDPIGKAHVRAAAQVIACEIHPVQNLKVLNRLRQSGFSEDAVNGWAKDTIEEGLLAFEALLPDASAPFCFGDAPGLADICMVPQLVNARRFGATIPPSLLRIEANCLALEAFDRALPEKQPDAE